MKPRKKKLVRLRVCKKCEKKYKTFAKRGKYCPKCYVEKRKHIVTRTLIRLFPITELNKTATIKKALSVGGFINKEDVKKEENRR